MIVTPGIDASVASFTVPVMELFPACAKPNNGKMIKRTKANCDRRITVPFSELTLLTGLKRGVTSRCYERQQRQQGKAGKLAG